VNEMFLYLNITPRGIILTEVPCLDYFDLLIEVKMEKYEILLAWN
jgi:hypothetical protein